MSNQLSSVLLILISMAAVGQESAMFRGGLQHSGVYESRGVENLARVKWKFHTDGPVISSPAFANGTVFVGSADGNLYAIEPESGTLKWKFATQARITSSPAIAENLVYFGSFDGMFYAVDATTGQLKWKFRTGGERRFAGKHIHGIEPSGEVMPDPFDVYLSSPAVWSGAVYFGSGDGAIYALDKDSGKMRWKFQTGDVVHASPAINHGTVFVGSWDSYFYALDAASGKEKWRFKTGEDHDISNQVGIQSSAAVVNDVVYFGCRDSNLYALDAASGQKLWAFNTKGSWVVTSPAVRDGRVFFATSDSALVHVVDAKSGASVFSLKSRWPLFSSPALAGDMLYLGSEEGTLIAIDVKSQMQSWEFRTDASRQNAASFSKADGTPNYRAVVHENFYDSVVAATEKMQSMGTVLSSPAVVNGVIYVGSTDGNLYALM
jgi:eukaryotic-like serine/threonine-protein kinase